MAAEGYEPSWLVVVSKLLTSGTVHALMSWTPYFVEAYLALLMAITLFIWFTKSRLSLASYIKIVTPLCVLSPQSTLGSPHHQSYRLTHPSSNSILWLVYAFVEPCIYPTFGIYAQSLTYSSDWLQYWYLSWLKLRHCSLRWFVSIKLHYGCSHLTHL